MIRCGMVVAHRINISNQSTLIAQMVKNCIKIPKGSNSKEVELVERKNFSFKIGGKKVYIK